MSTSAYDLYLGDISSLQGYRCRSLLRDSAPLVSARFSTGAAGQTDLDLLKSTSLDSLSGGMFQRTAEDPTKAARALGVFNRYDENVYPALPATLVSASLTGYKPNRKAEGENISFFAMSDFSAGVYYNSLYKVNKNDGSVTAVTLPAALATIVSVNACNITSLQMHGKYLYVASDSGVSAPPDTWRYDWAANTWVNYPGCYGSVFFEVRGTLYLLNAISDIYSVTNEYAAGVATFTRITSCGSADPNNIVTDAKEFNGAAWICKPDGIYRFDGSASVKVLPLVTTALQVWNGALYFYAGNWLYRFDGTNVTRLQYFGLAEPVSRLGLSATSDYLFVQTTALSSPYAQNDKDFALPGTKRTYIYDGVGMMLFSEANVTFGGSYITSLLYTGNRMFEFQADFSGSSWTTQYNRFNLDNLFLSTAVTTSSRIDITTSEFDDGFPNVFKSLEVIEPLYSGLIVGDSISVKYQYYDGKTWSAWVTAGTITSTSVNTIELTDATKKLFKRVKINVTLTPAAGSTATIKGVSWRYTLQPRARWRWQALVMAEGNGTISDRNGAAITADANAFSNSVLKCVKQKTPLFMFSPDFGQVKSQINAAATQFIVKGQPPIYTDPYSEYALCAVKNFSGVWEVLRVSSVSYNAGADETTINVAERGYYGVTPAQINAGAEFHLAYKVYVTRLLRDQPVLDDQTYTEQTTGESQLQREYLLEVTEV